MRLHVLLRDLGIGSRRKSEELIASGRVQVDGKPAHIGQQVTGGEEISVDGKVLAKAHTAEFFYIVMNKPIGFTSTTARFENERSVLELLPPKFANLTTLQIVGRLDKDSEGLLLLTNDGHTGYVLTHPKYQVKKVYEVVTEKSLSAQDEQRLLNGVSSVDEIEYRFNTIKNQGNNVYQVALTEGKKREIREALRCVGNQVRSLRRIELGPLSLGNLALGESRELSIDEAEALNKFIAQKAP